MGFNSGFKGLKNEISYLVKKHSVLKSCLSAFKTARDVHDSPVTLQHLRLNFHVFFRQCISWNCDSNVEIQTNSFSLKVNGDIIKLFHEYIFYPYLLEVFFTLSLQFFTSVEQRYLR